MCKTFVSIGAVFILALGIFAGDARAEWPAKVFAPYISPGNNALINCYNATGQKYFTLAFTNAARGGGAARGPATGPATRAGRGGRVGGGGGFANGAATQPGGAPATRRGRNGGGGGGGGGGRGGGVVAGGEPSFDGGPVTQHNFLDQIEALRAKGGDVIMSFGGAGGTEIAMTDADPAKVQAKYQEVVDAYKLTWIDLDVEGGSVANAQVNIVRNTALAGLQKKNPGLIVCYTLAVDPNGLSQRSIDLLTDATKQGLKVEAVNLMTMDYGNRYASKDMGALAILCTEAAHAQMQKIDPEMKVGVTPMIGRNDSGGEYYTLSDAKTVTDWASAQPWIRLLTFWQVSRDRTGPDGARASPNNSGVPQDPFAFTDICRIFTVGFTLADTRP